MAQQTIKDYPGMTPGMTMDEWLKKFGRGGSKSAPTEPKADLAALARSRVLPSRPLPVNAIAHAPMIEAHRRRVAHE